MLKISKNKRRTFIDTLIKIFLIFLFVILISSTIDYEFKNLIDLNLFFIIQISFFMFISLFVAYFLEKWRKNIVSIKKDWLKFISSKLKFYEFKSFLHLARFYFLILPITCFIIPNFNFNALIEIQKLFKSQLFDFIFFCIIFTFICLFIFYIIYNLMLKKILKTKNLHQVFFDQFKDDDCFFAIFLLIKNDEKENELIKLNDFKINQSYRIDFKINNIFICLKSKLSLINKKNYNPPIF